MLLFSKLWYNVLMDRKASKIDYKILSRYILILGIVVGVLLFANGVMQIKTYKDQAGTASLQEVTEEYEPLALELGKIKREKTAERDENGFSEKYYELANKQGELEDKVQKLANSKYMKETGWHNPKSLSEYFTTAPTLGVGLVFLFVSIVAVYVLKKIDREKIRAERAANKKAEKKESK